MDGARCPRSGRNVAANPRPQHAPDPERHLRLGGVHGASPGSVTLDATTAARFNLTVGKIYEIAILAQSGQSRSPPPLTSRFCRIEKAPRSPTSCFRATC